MKTELMLKASRLINNAGLKIKKHSPEILMTAGIIGTVASTVMACKATTKINTILDETKTTVDAIHNGMEQGNINGVEYTEKDGTKDLTIVYTQTGVKLFKLYAPAIAVGALSITAIVSGHKILKTRNLALAAAYAVVDKGFKDYRKNVVERFGEELDKELRYNIKAKEIETEVVDKKGNKTVKKETVNIAEENPLDTYSKYSRVWCEGNTGWTKDPEYNMMYLRHQQSYFNDLLKNRGHVFLNEVYDVLGYPRTKDGQIVGWVYNKKNKYSDNYIDFGIYNINIPANRDFINGFERSIVLDFNVDGPIYNLI